MEDEIDLSEAILYADSNRGVYIPQFFAQSINREFVVEGIEDFHYETLLQGPDDVAYWDTWDIVLNNALIEIPELGRRGWLYQDGDLWIVPYKKEGQK